MGWREASVEDLRRAFVDLALLDGANVSALCERFGISRQTGYVWLRRARAGERSFTNRSRRPLSSPGRLASEVEAAICAVRHEHPAWGARKIAAVLARTGDAPAVSTVHAALERNGLILDAARRPQAYGRFERDEPNSLWQMDFKGREKLANGEWVHPLTILDDCSRYAVGLSACADQQTTTVRDRLIDAFRQHGLPEAIYVDNGGPWGCGQPGHWTRLRIWLLKLGVETIYGEPYHPQGRGKCERFHRSLMAEVFSMAALRGFDGAQAAFDHWRRVYNIERPHEALGLASPASRYWPSPRSYPERLPGPDYEEGETVRKVGTTKPYISYQGKLWLVPQAFAGETVAIRPRQPDGAYGIFFGAIQIAAFSMNQPQAKT